MTAAGAVNLLGGNWTTFGLRSKGGSFEAEREKEV